ncbi:hypothetical protein GQ42DRAFT_160986 [Ramicandelaber brevisporus]|nr:hypothetical protein GQ42DRAFT_162554 [Ramicandelaber brevisporus]KAI8872838.1 hypothetical protein GQ42DRAFT_160986 [Ramicandelaber brevisporus]
MTRTGRKPQQRQQQQQRSNKKQSGGSGGGSKSLLSKSSVSKKKRSSSSKDTDALKSAMSFLDSQLIHNTDLAKAVHSVAKTAEEIEMEEQAERERIAQKEREFVERRDERAKVYEEKMKTKKDVDDAVNGLADIMLSMQ